MPAVNAAAAAASKNFLAVLVMFRTPGFRVVGCSSDRSAPTSIVVHSCRGSDPRCPPVGRKRPSLGTARRLTLSEHALLPCTHVREVDVDQAGQPEIRSAAAEKTPCQDQKPRLLCLSPWNWPWHPRTGEDTLLRWLPKPLIRLYQRLVAARPYARPRRVPAPPGPPPTPSGQERQFRLEIAQDAFCHHRPAPRLLFRTQVPRRGLRSWCEQPHRRTGRRGHICPACAHARTLYAAAVDGDTHAEQRLHTLARRGAVRLSAERRYDRFDRSRTLAARREERKRRSPNPIPPALVDFRDWGGVYRSFLHHVHDRRAVEQALLRDHARHLRHLIRQRCARLARASRPRHRDHERASRDAPPGSTAQGDATKRVAGGPGSPRRSALRDDRSVSSAADAASRSPATNTAPAAPDSPGPLQPADHPTAHAESPAAQPQPAAGAEASVRRIAGLLVRALVLISLSAGIASAAAFQRPAQHVASCIEHQPSAHTAQAHASGGQPSAPAGVIGGATRARSARRSPGRRRCTSSPPRASARAPPAH